MEADEGAPAVDEEQGGIAPASRTFTWEVDGVSRELTVPEGAAPGDEREFSFVAADGSTREADELRERLREQRRLALEVADGARALEEKAHEATTRADREAREVRGRAGVCVLPWRFRAASEKARKRRRKGALAVKRRGRPPRDGGCMPGHKRALGSTSLFPRVQRDVRRATSTGGGRPVLV